MGPRLVSRVILLALGALMLSSFRSPRDLFADYSLPEELLEELRLSYEESRPYDGAIGRVECIRR